MTLYLTNRANVAFGIAAQTVFIGLVGFEPTASWSRTRRSTKLSHSPFTYENGVYYARLKVNGKEIRRSLRTSDRDMAKRELARLREEQKHIDRSQGKLTLGELCTRFLKTVQYQKLKTIGGETLVARRVLESYQRTRWYNGSTFLWIGRYRETGRGQGSSNLRFDQIDSLKE